MASGAKANVSVLHSSCIAEYLAPVGMYPNFFLFPSFRLPGILFTPSLVAIKNQSFKQKNKQEATHGGPFSILPNTAILMPILANSLLPFAPPPSSKTFLE